MKHGEAGYIATAGMYGSTLGKLQVRFDAAGKFIDVTGKLKDVTGLPLEGV